MKVGVFAVFIFFFAISFSCQAQIFDFSLENKNIFQYVNESKNELIDIVFGVFYKISEEVEKKERSEKAALNLSKEMDFSLMQNVLEMVKASHIKGKTLDYKKLIVGATNGMLQAIDPWSRLEAGDDFKEYWSLSRGSLYGIGAKLKKKGRYVSITSTIKGSSAESAGLQKGDIIEGVDGRSVRNMKIADVVSLVRGDLGTKVVLQIYRKGSEPCEFDVELSRSPIVLDTVSFEFKNIGDKKIGVIKIKSFDADTANQFAGAGDAILEQGVSGIVIDLRNNPGGSLDEVNRICAVMCGREKILTITEYASGVRYPVYSNPLLNLAWPKDRAFENIPIVCLVNKMSASASEIMAACLRENLGVKIIGEKTFGKGVGQQVQTTEEGILLLTTFKWLSPLGNSIEGVGIEPDFVIENEIPDEPEDVNVFAIPEDVQMDKGLEVLKRSIEVKDFQKRFFN